MKCEFLIGFLIQLGAHPSMIYLRLTLEKDTIERFGPKRWVKTKVKITQNNNIKVKNECDQFCCTEFGQCSMFSINRISAIVTHIYYTFAQHLIV